MQANPTQYPSLPAAIADYFASQTSNPEAVARCFTEDGVVVDEQHEHRGRSAISAWNAAANAAYSFATEVLAAETHDTSTTVLGKVTGTFPGGAIQLRFQFTLAGAAHLAAGDWPISLDQGCWTVLGSRRSTSATAIGGKLIMRAATPFGHTLQAARAECGEAQRPPSYLACCRSRTGVCLPQRRRQPPPACAAVRRWLRPRAIRTCMSLQRPRITRAPLRAGGRPSTALAESLIHRGRCAVPLCSRLACSC